MQTLFDPNHPLHHRFNCQCESGLQLYYRTEQPHYNHSWNVFSVSFLHSPTEGHEAHLPQCVCADRFSPSPIMDVYTIFIFFWLLYSICGNHVFVSVEWFENALKWIVLPLLKSNVCKKKGTQLFTPSCFELIDTVIVDIGCLYVFFLCTTWVYRIYFILFHV